MSILPDLSHRRILRIGTRLYRAGLATVLILGLAGAPGWGDRSAFSRLGPELKELLQSRGRALDAKPLRIVRGVPGAMTPKPRRGLGGPGGALGSPATQAPLWRLHQTKAGVETVSTLIQGDAKMIASAVTASGGWVKWTQGEIVSAEVPVSSLEQLAATPGIIQIESPSGAQPMNDVSTASVGGREVINHLAYAGNGVVVGIVDSGVDWRHPDFRKPDGTSRILYIWDQTDDSGTPPVGFGYGTEYTKAQIDAALAGNGTVLEADDSSTVGGHGTHVLGTAAGNGLGDPSGKYAGMAPNADLIVVKTDWTNMLDGNQYILSKCSDVLHKPVVVNNSWGVQEGPHNGRSLDCAALNAMINPQTPGQAVVFAGGNEGDDVIHVGGTIDDQEGYFKVRVDSSNRMGVDIWNTAGTVIEAGVSYYVGLDSLSRPIYNTVYCTPGDYANHTITNSEGPDCTYVGSEIAIDATGTPTAEDPSLNHIYISVQVQGDTSIPFRICLRRYSGEIGTFDAWLFTKGCEIDNTGDSQARYFGDSIKTIAEPSSAQNVITVGSFITKNQWIDAGGTTQTDPYLPHALGDLSIFSSRGPVNAGYLKPDLVAPGEMIASARSADGPSSPDHELAGGFYVVKDGTSSAAPHVTGAIALMLEKNPNLTGAQIRQYLTSTSRTDSTMGSIPNTNWGWGKLNVMGAVNAVPPVTPDTTPPAAPIVTDDGQYTYAIGALHASWRAYDRESGVVEYQYAVGTQPGLADVASWTGTGSQPEVTRGGLSLTYGNTYYISAKARNSAGMWSTAGSSDGIIYMQDLTQPTTPVVADDGAVTRRLNELAASWSSNDPESGIAEYQYAIGTTPGATNIVGWTSTGLATSVRATGLSLSNGLTYYFSVKALNRANLWSAAGSSDGIRVDLSSASLACSAWPMFGHDATHYARSRYQATPTAQLQWSASYNGYEAPTSLVIGQDGTVYFGGGNGNSHIYGIDPTTGDLRYSPFSAEPGSGILGTPCIAADGILYIGSTDGYLYALNHDLTLYGKVNLGKPIASSPVLGPNGTIYVGIGSEKSKEPGALCAVSPDLIQTWSFPTGGSVISSPAVGPDGVIYVGSKDGSLYAISPNGTQKWKFDTGLAYPQPMRSSPALSPDGTAVYIGSDDYALYAVSTATGQLLWKTFANGGDLGGRVYSSPAVAADGTIYVGSETGGMFAINPNGTLKWSRYFSDPVQSSPSIGVDGTVYIGCTNGSLYALRPGDGTILWSYYVEYPIWGAPAIGPKGQIYAMADGYGSDIGRIYALSSSETVTSPEGFVKLGWNLVGLPATPVDPDPLMVLAGIDVNNSSLQYWNNNHIEGGGYLNYGMEWFGPMVVGTPYWFQEFESSKTLSYTGYANTTDQSISFMGGGGPRWAMFSLPFPYQMDCTRIQFSTPNHPDLMDWQTAYNGTHVESSVMGFDASQHAFFSAGPSTYMVERTRIEPWYGYWVLIYDPEGLTITFPAITQ